MEAAAAWEEALVLRPRFSACEEDGKDGRMSAGAAFKLQGCVWGVCVHVPGGRRRLQAGTRCWPLGSPLGPARRMGRMGR